MMVTPICSFKWSHLKLNSLKWLCKLRLLTYWTPLSNLRLLKHIPYWEGLTGMVDYNLDNWKLGWCPLTAAGSWWHQNCDFPFQCQHKNELCSDFDNCCALCLKKCTRHSSHTAHLYELKLGATISNYNFISPTASLHHHFFAIVKKHNHGWPPSENYTHNPK